MELATLFQRFRGALVDGLVAFVPYLMIREFEEEPLVRLAGFGLLLVLFGVQAWLLARDGQSIGKKLAGTRIVRVDTEQNGGFVTNVLMRAIVASLPNAIPVYYVIDSLFVFRQDRRCLHDFIAKTKVVKV